MTNWTTKPKAKERALENLKEFLEARDKFHTMTDRGIVFILALAAKNFTGCKDVTLQLNDRVQEIVVAWAKQFYSIPVNSSLYRKWIATIRSYSTKES